MDRKVIQVEPLEMITVKHKHSFCVNIIVMKIFVSVTISVSFFDENNICIDFVTLELTGEDYTNWGTDDNYLINYVAEKYGMTVKAQTAQADEPTTEVIKPGTEAVE